jgi:hypothetical protein
MAVLIAMLALTAHTAPKKGGGNSNATPATIEFDDLLGDAIQSDGAGPYDVSLTEDGSVTIISFSKKQEIWLDFSDCDPAPDLTCDGPFRSGTKSGFVGAAEIAITELQGAPGDTERVGFRIGFRTSEGKWSVGMVADVTRFDDDGDGVSDRFVIEHDGTTSVSLYRFFSRRGIGPGYNWIEQGRYFLPWGATLSIP